MSTTAVTPAATTADISPASSAALPSLETLTSTDFMQILLAEFQNQDPTQPTDPTEFASQMVQFANLGQLQSINQAVQPQTTTNLMQAASDYIGRQVVAPGNAIGVTGGSATAIAYTPATTDNYSALVSNSSGQLIATVPLGSLTAATPQTFTWAPASGVADGTYTVQIVNSANVPVNGLQEQGLVQSVALSNGAVVLNLGNNLVVPQSAVATVAQTSSSGFLGGLL